MHQPGRRRRPTPRGARRRPSRGRSGPRRRPPPKPQRRASGRQEKQRRERERQEKEERERRKRESGSFEIRKGRSGSESDHGESDETPIEQVVLPQSITQEAEDEKFYKRFGAERTADLSGVSGKVVLAQSAGAYGPDRYLRRRKIVIALVVLLLAAAGAAYFFWPQIQDALKK